MSDEVQANNGEATSREPDADWFLQNLVSQANNIENFNFALTLTVNGSIVSGVLIGGKEYFTAFADDFVEGWDEGEIKKSWQEGVSGLGVQVYGEGNRDPTEPSFIHLKDARIHHPVGNIPSEKGVLWRGRLNAVSGFWLGRVVSSD